MHARVASGVFLALGFADLAVLNLLLAPRFVAEQARRTTAPYVLAAHRRAPELPKAEAPRAPALPKAETPKGPEPKVAASAPAAEPKAAVSAAPDVLFGLESTRITSVAAALAVQRLAIEMRSGGTARSVLLRGHADRLGGTRANMTLSRQRAESVRHLLIAHGVPKERIAVEAVGDAEPADSSDTPAAWAKNRRVQILWR